jgi:hypothetical protein
MAAGQGFKTFATGDVLTSSDVNGYLMQGVLVFASAADRTAAITSPQQGQVSFLKDTNVTQYYSGSAWVTVGGSSSPLTTKGDLYTYSTADARLGVGTNGQILTADSTAATGIKWATASTPSSGLTLISTTTMSAVSSQSFNNVFTSTYDNYLVVGAFTASAASQNLNARLRVGGTDNATASSYVTQILDANDTSITGSRLTNDLFQALGVISNVSSIPNAFSGVFYNPAKASPTSITTSTFACIGSAYTRLGYASHNQSTAYDGFTLIPGSGTITGSVSIYGYAK